MLIQVLKHFFYFSKLYFMIAHEITKKCQLKINMYLHVLVILKLENGKLIM